MIMAKNRLILNKTKCSDCNFKKSIRYKKSKNELDIIASRNCNETESYKTYWCIVSSSKVLKTKNGRTMLLSKCAIWGSKKSRFVKEQEAKRLSSSVGLRTLLNKVPLLGDILF